MRIVEKYSHLNGEEYLLVHHKSVYREILDVIKQVNADQVKTKVSEEKTMKGRLLYNPDALNSVFKGLLRSRGWGEKRYSYYVTTDVKIMKHILELPLTEQKLHLREHGIQSPIQSYKQTDFVKDGIAIEVQFGKYAFVAYDLFVKHLLFYSGNVINVGIEG